MSIQRRIKTENKDIITLTEAYKEIFATKNLTDNLSKLNGEFKENPLVRDLMVMNITYIIHQVAQLGLKLTLLLLT